MVECFRFAFGGAGRVNYCGYTHRENNNNGTGCIEIDLRPLSLVAALGAKCKRRLVY